MPDDPSTIRRLLGDIRKDCSVYQDALLQDPPLEMLVTIRQGLELCMDRLDKVRDWVDERIR